MTPEEKAPEGALDAPPLAHDEPHAAEVLRIWSAPDGVQQLSLRTTWSDPGAWGLLLVDIARHAARAYARHGIEEDVALARIHELLCAEWADATDEPEELGG
ncbi:MAG: DUF5076 domain-containing protein [Gemmatimonadetes bacterium]|nr:DUF5076 domain-containing protein [Gemmatimonadota bacterium]NIR81289.1 DUF5076 domain-containing protein [Gemmatimonadota bacterium]NIT90124.1 DUF5076 domain-containing protein [Gemmatimonadota bacterium]NIU33951.1 DUF5076 domain-containing protein [Gemmatimonadota bacterium]NIU38130.1 DUF5076 domain-containing protein [Gemmatimonadota bacterium]